jgi:DNA helicase-2/ATP-dependent DNA helicase PcrA
MNSIVLNSSQKKAVAFGEGPLLIIAGAGTGKTRVITQRISHLIDSGKAESNEILALTFTQKAAQEMEERVDIALPYGFTDVWISTFHSFCDQILRQEALHLGIDPDYVLMTSAQEYLYFRKHLYDFDIESLRPHGNPTKFIGAILSHFSRLGDECVSVEDYSAFVESMKDSKDVEAELKERYGELSELFRQYTEQKTKDSRLGFSDLVPLTVKLFKEYKSVLDKYREKFKYVLVDEFQDTNYAQNELLKTLIPANGNITVVGDDDQAIYKFRGAAVSNILDFKKTFSQYEKVVLTKNYRSCQEILDRSYSLIQENNPDRLEVKEDIDKKLQRVYPQLPKGTDDAGDDVSDQQIGLDIYESDVNAPADNSNCSHDAVRRIHAANDVDEAELVVREIEDLVNEEDLNYSDIAILVRANNHADQFISSLRYHGIPFQFTGPKGLYNRPEIKDLIAMLRVIIDYIDDASMYRILTIESESKSLAPREFIDIQRLSKKEKMSIFELLERIVGKPVDKPEYLDRSDGHGDRDFNEIVEENINSDKYRKLFDKLFSKESQLWIEKLLASFQKAFEMTAEGRSVGEVLYEMLTRVGYLDELVAERSIREEWKIQNISKFFKHLKSFEGESENGSVFEFMEYLDYALEIGESPTVDPVDMIDFDAVNISTVHGAKGLEFPAVFMVNLVSSRFPSRNMSDTLPIPEELIKETLPEGDEHIQEERRLFYVGMTRAERFLYLTSADYYGDGVRKKKQSRFLHDLDLVEESVLKAKKKVDVESIPNIIKAENEDMLPPDLRKSMLEKITHNLSYSHISTYQKCPYQFYFKYFLGIPGMESQSRSFGMTIHNTLRAFYEEFRRYKQGLPGISDLPDKKDLMNIYKSKWIPSGYEDKDQEQNRFVKGKVLLKKFYDEFVSKDQNPIWLEEKFRVHLEDFWFRGVVDRLDRKDDGLILIDYKTGKIPSRDVGKDLQLALYSMAIEGIKKEPVKEGYLLYLEGPTEFKVDISEDVQEEAKEEVISTLEDIRSLDFTPNPGFLCKFCDYRNICDYALD